MMIVMIIIRLLLKGYYCFSRPPRSSSWAHWSAQPAIGVISAGGGCGKGEGWDGLGWPSARWMSRRKAEPKRPDGSCWPHSACKAQHQRCTHCLSVCVWWWHAEAHQGLHCGWGSSGLRQQLVGPDSGWTQSIHSAVVCPWHTMCQKHWFRQYVVWGMGVPIFQTNNGKKSLQGHNEVPALWQEGDPTCASAWR